MNELLASPSFIIFPQSWGWEHLLLHHWPIKPSYMYHSTPYHTKDKGNKLHTWLPHTAQKIKKIHVVEQSLHDIVQGVGGREGGRAREGERGKERDSSTARSGLGIGWRLPHWPVLLYTMYSCRPWDEGIYTHIIYHATCILEQPYLSPQSLHTHT